MSENSQPTNQEILDAINDFAGHVEERFQGQDARFESIDKRFDKLEVKVVKIEATMVTKDYLDEKMAD